MLGWGRGWPRGRRRNAACPPFGLSGFGNFWLRRAGSQGLTLKVTLELRSHWWLQNVPAAGMSNQPIPT